MKVVEVSMAVVAESLHGSSGSFHASRRKAPVGTVGASWSSGDIRDACPGFPLFDLHLDGKTDTAACSEIVAHNGPAVGRSAGGGSVVKGLPEAAGRLRVVGQPPVLPCRVCHPGSRADK